MTADQRVRRAERKIIVQREAEANCALADCIHQGPVQAQRVVEADGVAHVGFEVKLQFNPMIFKDITGCFTLNPIC